MDLLGVILQIKLWSCKDLYGSQSGGEHLLTRALRQLPSPSTAQGIPGTGGGRSFKAWGGPGREGLRSEPSRGHGLHYPLPQLLRMLITTGETPWERAGASRRAERPGHPQDSGMQISPSHQCLKFHRGFTTWVSLFLFLS